jgi:pimeloyl-ACP methyl ester carboxylesterase
MDQVADIAAIFERDCGTGQMTAQACPALVSDPSFLDYAAERERRTASPATAAAYARAMATSDIRELLPRLAVPTLVYYSGDLVHLPVEHSRYRAEHIPGAILVENPGRSF